MVPEPSSSPPLFIIVDCDAENMWGKRADDGVMHGYGFRGRGEGRRGEVSKRNSVLVVVGGERGLT